MSSKTQIDRAGKVLITSAADSPERRAAEIVLDEYRVKHLQPLSELTQELQHWLFSYGAPYYIAHRLKRKPQIIKKLRRLSVRLTQLQDIGGCRIIVDTNEAVDKLLQYLKSRVEATTSMSLDRVTDYRERGREESGYRALHLILERAGAKLELQLRSKIQHRWAESIERTSVIYGYDLKAQAGDRAVVAYFKRLSDLYYEVENGRRPSAEQRIDVELLREKAERIIRAGDKGGVLDSFVNEGIIKTLMEKERHLGSGVNNWILVFNWSDGSFISWTPVDRDPKIAVGKYVEQETSFPAEHGFEVVLVGASEVAMVRETHSHYFGLDKDAPILETFDAAIFGFSRTMDLDVGARKILLALHKKKRWGKQYKVAQATLRNHYCKDVMTFDDSLKVLLARDLVECDTAGGPVWLVSKRKSDIEKYM